MCPPVSFPHNSAPFSVFTQRSNCPCGTNRRLPFTASPTVTASGPGDSHIFFPVFNSLRYAIEPPAANTRPPLMHAPECASPASSHVQTGLPSPSPTHLMSPSSVPNSTRPSATAGGDRIEFSASKLQRVSPCSASRQNIFFSRPNSSAPPETIGAVKYCDFVSSCHDHSSCPSAASNAKIRPSGRPSLRVRIKNTRPSATASDL